MRAIICNSPCPPLAFLGPPWPSRPGEARESQSNPGEAREGHGRVGKATEGEGRPKEASGGKAKDRNGGVGKIPKEFVGKSQVSSGRIWNSLTLSESI